MKVFMDKRYRINRYLLMAVISLSWLACDENREINYTDQANQVQVDPYLQVVTGFVPFEVGTESYDLEFNVINGVDAVESIKLYGSFFDAESELTSNEVLYGEYPVDDPLRSVITESLTYDELKAGLLVDGNPLPDSDEDIFAGSGWTFRFEGDYASGETLPLNGEINMVLSKYAGIYRVSESTYMRIQVDVVTFPGEGVAHWDDEEVFIGFVDQNTLSYNDRWGYFASPGCSWNFDYDEDGTVTQVPILVTVVCPSAAATAANCTENLAGFNNLSAYLGYSVCAESNVIIDNDVTGEHVIKLTYGYLGGGGYRQFTETLTKIVD